MTRTNEDPDHASRVADRMRTDLPTIDDGLTLDDARDRMFTFAVDRLVVLDDGGEVVGIVSRRDLDHATAVGVDGGEPIRLIGLDRHWFCRPNAEASDTAQRMAAGNVTSVIVLENGEPVGVFAPSDHRGPTSDHHRSPPPPWARTRVTDFVSARAAFDGFGRMLRPSS